MSFEEGRNLARNFSATSTISPVRGLWQKRALGGGGLEQPKACRSPGVVVSTPAPPRPPPCHNPRTGEAIEVPAGYRAKFRPSSKLLEG